MRTYTTVRATVPAIRNSSTMGTLSGDGLSIVPVVISELWADVTIRIPEHLASYLAEQFPETVSAYTTDITCAVSRLGREEDLRVLNYLNRHQSHEDLDGSITIRLKQYALDDLVTVARKFDVAPADIIRAALEQRAAEIRRFRPRGKRAS